MWFKQQNIYIYISVQVNRWWGLLKTLFVGIFIWFLFYSRPQMSGLFIASHQNDKSDICLFLFPAYLLKKHQKKIAFHFKITFHYHSARDSFTFFLLPSFFSTIDKTIKLWFMATNYIPKKAEPQRGVLQIDWRHIFISLCCVLCFDDCWF